jgi:hypothetical protein
VDGDCRVAAAAVTHDNQRRVHAGGDNRGLGAKTNESFFKFEETEGKNLKFRMNLKFRLLYLL